MAKKQLATTQYHSGQAYLGAPLTAYPQSIDRFRRECDACSALEEWLKLPRRGISGRLSVGCNFRQIYRPGLSADFMTR